jgi:hypothetical protein
VAGIVLTVTGQRTFLGQKLLRPDDTSFERAITPEGEELGTPPLQKVSNSDPPDGNRPRGLLVLAALLAVASLLAVGVVLWRRRG